MSHVLGLDVSTTATKAVILDERGRVRATGAAEYPYETPRPLWSEQDPSLWWNGTIHAVRAALGDLELDRRALSARGQPYERLDQLTVELLLGAR